MNIDKILKYVTALPEETEDGNILKYICDKLNYRFKGNGVFSSIFINNESDFVFRLTEIVPNEQGPKDAWWEYIRDFSRKSKHAPTVYILKKLTRYRYLAVCKKLYTYSEYINIYGTEPHIELCDLCLLREGVFDDNYTQLKNRNLQSLICSIKDQFRDKIYNLDLWGDNLLFDCDGTPIVNDPVCVYEEDGSYTRYMDTLETGVMKMRGADHVY